MSHRELVIVNATYYAPGNFVDDDIRDAFMDDGGVWWYPGAAQDAQEKSLSACAPRRVASHDDPATIVFATDAVLFSPTCAALNGTGEHAYDLPGVIAAELHGSGWRDILADHVDALKAICDQVRGVSGARSVQAMVVFDCDSGREPDTWVGEGEYWVSIEPVGLLDLRQATVATWQRAKDKR